MPRGNSRIFRDENSIKFFHIPFHSKYIRERSYANTFMELLFELLGKVADTISNVLGSTKKD